MKADRLEELIAEREERYLAARPVGARFVERAGNSLAGGVASSWQLARPRPMWVTGGKGSKIYDVDGFEYVDLHNGYGSMLVGHAHPAIASGVSERMREGSQFAIPTEDAILVAEELRRRFNLPLWRYTNSGTEATMDAIHLMRAATGRRKIVKIEGSYHGHHDAVQVSVAPTREEAGPADRPRSVPASTGIPLEMIELTLVAPFNDVDALGRLFEDEADEIAGVIMEPVMMNAGIITPEPGYLEAVRELAHRHGAFLAFDEVKTGLAAGPGGATGAYGVTPDIVCLAKALGGGLPCGAIGGTERIMSLIVDHVYDQVGTFNGNPLTMVAARITLTEILDANAYAHLEALRVRMASGVGEIAQEFDLPAHAVTVGAKGCVTFSSERVRNYRDFAAIDDSWSHAHWLFQLDGGVMLPNWGKAEQWTLSVQHSSDDVERFVDNFRGFAKTISS